MKILEVITSLSPGGGERFVVDLSNALCNSRNQIILLTLKENINSNKSLFKFCSVTFLSPPVSPFPQPNRT